MALVENDDRPEESIEERCACQQPSCRPVPRPASARDGTCRSDRPAEHQSGIEKQPSFGRRGKEDRKDNVRQHQG
jgi:hypothetical protein